MSDLITVKCDCGNTLIIDDEISKNKCKNRRYKISYKELIIKLEYDNQYKQITSYKN